LCIGINEERWPVWSDVDGVSGNAVLGEQLLGLETVRTVKAGKGHDFMDADFVLAKIEHVGELPLAKFTGVRPFSCMGSRVAVVVVLLVEALVANDAGKSLLDAAQVDHVDVRLQGRVKLESLGTVLALVVPQP